MAATDKELGEREAFALGKGSAKGSSPAKAAIEAALSKKFKLVRVGSILRRQPHVRRRQRGLTPRSGTNTAIYKSRGEGFMSLLAGSADEGGYADGAGALAQFGSIFDMVICGDGTLVVADGDNHCLRLISRDCAGAIARWVTGGWQVTILSRSMPLLHHSPKHKLGSHRKPRSGL
jgi:hypothetical protein